MPFCPNCGSPTEGRFCAKCGAPVESGGGPSARASGPQIRPAIAGTGLEDHVAGALCYLAGFFTGVIFLVLEPYSRRPFVRFHALQSILLCAVWMALSLALSVVLAMTGIALGSWWIFIPLRMLIGLLGFVLWLFCMYKAFNREQFELPFIGPIAAKHARGQPV
jgi:uncharacterized membrane protein